MRIEINGYITDGKLSLYHREYLDKWVKANPDCNVILTIDVKKKKRSTNQNSYYWACVVPLVRDGLNHLGNEFSLDDTHSFLKARFNYKEIVNEETGEIAQVPVSTTDLSTFAFNEYKEKIQRFSAEFLNITIPDPEHPLEIDFNRIEHNQ